MKLHVLNDLHIEFADFELPATDADVIILAGDTVVGESGLAWLERQSLNKPVIYVPGNHEFYRHDITLVDKLKARSPLGVYVLNNDVLEINGVRFLGTVLWTDFLLFGDADKYLAMQHARKGMNDFSLIRINGQRYTPEDSIRLHQESRGWLEMMLGRPYEGKTVIITHHAPSSRSVPARYSKDLLTPAYASNLEGLMAGHRVSVWAHGHTHNPFDYNVHGTRVICNPRGYIPYERLNGFKPDLVIEI